GRRAGQTLRDQTVDLGEPAPAEGAPAALEPSEIVVAARQHVPEGRPAVAALELAEQGVERGAAARGLDREHRARRDVEGRALEFARQVGAAAGTLQSLDQAHSAGYEMREQAVDGARRERRAQGAALPAPGR